MKLVRLLSPSEVVDIVFDCLFYRRISLEDCLKHFDYLYPTEKGLYIYNREDIPSIYSGLAGRGQKNASVYADKIAEDSKGFKKWAKQDIDED